MGDPVLFEETGDREPSPVSSILPAVPTAHTTLKALH